MSLLVSGAVFADSVDDYIEAVRSEEKIAGIALMVLRDGKVIKDQGYGFANLEHDVPVTSKTIFQSGSVGKQFTAAGVMLLVEDKKLISRHRSLATSRRGRRAGTGSPRVIC